MKNSEDRKAFPKFLVILICAAIFGGIIGTASNMLQENTIQQMMQMLLNGVQIAILPATIVTVLIIWIVFIVMYLQCKQTFQKWDGEEESVVEKIELKLGYLLLVLSAANIVLFFLFGANVTIFSFEEDATGVFLLTLCGFIVGVASVIIQQFMIVALTKKINPEKKGSIFDVKFAKKWEASCDEAERLTMYKAGYQSYRITNTSCIVIWLIAVLGGQTFHWGMVPVVCVTAIWMIMTVSFCLADIRLSKEHLNNLI